MSGWTLGTTMKRTWMAAGVAAVILWTAQGLQAENAAGAARLSNVDGQVQVMQNGQTVSSQALQNMPLFALMQVSTASDGKAEIQFEDGSVARIAPNSVMTLMALNGPNGAEVALNRGLGYFEVPTGSTGQLRVRFGASTATAASGTVLRLRMDTPPGDLAVFAGQAHLDRVGGTTVDLQTGESVTLDASTAGGFRRSESIESDSWDAWNQDRDQALNSEATQQTDTSANVTGNTAPNPAWSTLDANGVWYQMPDGNYVWSPYEASSADWDPYGCGHWVWTPGYGYVWVSCEQWGFLPYMCGSWSYYSGFGWGWEPGLGAGCGGGWGMGYGGGILITRAPEGYIRLARPAPGSRQPVGAPPMHPIGIERRGHWGETGLPTRSRDGAIAGAGMRPVGPSRGDVMQQNRQRPGQDAGRGTNFANRPTTSQPAQPQPTQQRTGVQPQSDRQTPSSTPQRQGYAPGQQNGTPGQSMMHAGQPATVPVQTPRQGTTPAQGFQQQRTPQPQQPAQMRAQPSSQPRVQQNAQPTFHPSAPSHSNFGGGAPAQHSAPAPSSSGGSHSGSSSGGNGNHK